MKLSPRFPTARKFWLSACLGAFAAVLPSSAEGDVAAFLSAGREVPVNTSAREIRAQPVMQFVQAEFYNPSSEPGAIRPSFSNDEDPPLFSSGSSYLDSNDRRLVYRRAKPSPLPIFSLLDMFTSSWDEPDAQEDDTIEEDEIESNNYWLDDVPLQARSQSKLRYGRRS